LKISSRGNDLESHGFYFQELWPEKRIVFFFLFLTDSFIY
jgi:hypothetical protein